MNFQISSNTKVILTVLLAAVILLLSLFFGINNGKALAQSAALSQSAQNLKQGLQYFYQDQDRYPSADEFQNPSVMLNYFNLFPPAEIPSGSCLQSFKYQRLAKTSYSLDFCLPKSVGNFSSGWNRLTESK